jgi:hypothetical protein
MISPHPLLLQLLLLLRRPVPTKGMQPRQQGQILQQLQQIQPDLE